MRPTTFTARPEVPCFSGRGSAVWEPVPFRSARSSPLHGGPPEVQGVRRQASLSTTLVCPTATRRSINRLRAEAKSEHVTAARSRLQGLLSQLDECATCHLPFSLCYMMPLLCSTVPSARVYSGQFTYTAGLPSHYCSRFPGHLNSFRTNLRQTSGWLRGKGRCSTRQVLTSKTDPWLRSPGVTRKEL